MSAVECKDLWFSYEVAQSTSATAKTIDASKAAAKETIYRDGGLSVDAPRMQYDAGTEIVYKVCCPAAHTRSPSPCCRLCTRPDGAVLVPLRSQLQLAGVNMSLPLGSRCMLVGANGAGKTTLMSVIGGKHMVDQSAVRVLGRAAFEDTTLSAELALLTGNWTHTVAFAGHSVPYQAMEVSTLISSNSAGVDPARVARLVRLLEVDPSWNLTEVSDGQRRRVQILCKLMKPFKILLLDEITTDLDLLARHDLLTFLREESEERGVSIVYCTHIFDGLDGWASHVAYVKKGEMMFCEPVAALGEQLAVPAAQQARGWGALFCAVQRWLLDARPDFAKLLTTPAPMTAFSPPACVAGLPPAVSLRDFSWTYSGAKRANQLQNLTFDVPRGARCLLVGANGAGKTTLLKMLGGKHMVPREQVLCLGLSSFHDIELNKSVSLLSGDWTRQVRHHTPITHPLVSACPRRLWPRLLSH